MKFLFIFFLLSLSLLSLAQTPQIIECDSLDFLEKDDSLTLKFYLNDKERDISYRVQKIYSKINESNYYTQGGFKIYINFNNYGKICRILLKNRFNEIQVVYKSTFVCSNNT